VAVEVTVSSLPALSVAWRVVAAAGPALVVLVVAGTKSKTNSFSSRSIPGMDPPKTRSESKKDPRAKAQGKTVYSAKHVRQLEALKEKKKKT
jgi:hypothetical protein